MLYGERQTQFLGPGPGPSLQSPVSHSAQRSFTGGWTEVPSGQVASRLRIYILGSSLTGTFMYPGTQCPSLRNTLIFKHLPSHVPRSSKAKVLTHPGYYRAWCSVIMELSLRPQVLTHFDAPVCRCSDRPLLRCLHAQLLSGLGPPTLRSSHIQVFPHSGPPTPGSSPVVVESHCQFDRTNRSPGALSCDWILTCLRASTPRCTHTQVHPTQVLKDPGPHTPRCLPQPGLHVPRCSGTQSLSRLVLLCVPVGDSHRRKGFPEQGMNPYLRWGIFSDVPVVH